MDCKVFSVLSSPPCARHLNATLGSRLRAAHAAAPHALTRKGAPWTCFDGRCDGAAGWGGAGAWLGAALRLLPAGRFVVCVCWHALLVRADGMLLWSPCCSWSRVSRIRHAADAAPWPAPHVLSAPSRAQPQPGHAPNSCRLLLGVCWRVHGAGPHHAVQRRCLPSVSLLPLTPAPPSVPVAPSPTTLSQVVTHTDQSRVLHHGGLARHFNNPALSDLWVLAPDGRRFAVHRVILAAASNPLGAMLEAGEHRGQLLSPAAHACGMRGRLRVWEEAPGRVARGKSHSSVVLPSRRGPRR